MSNLPNLYNRKIKYTKLYKIIRKQAKKWYLAKLVDVKKIVILK
jgi:hypothetical protein